MENQANNQISGAEAVIRCLLAEGVDLIYGYPGGAIMPIYDELYKYSDDLTHILTRHEQGATHSAQGYARTSGKVGVAIATSGPGATNLVTGIADANPLVKYLEEKGHSIKHLKYSDHYNYISNDINNILAKYNEEKSTKKLILTTEKDATKLKQFLPHFNNLNFHYIPIEIKIEQSEKFKNQILDYVEKN